MDIGIILLIVFALNSISAMVVRNAVVTERPLKIVPSKSFIKRYEQDSENCSKAPIVYLVAGFLNQPTALYRHINFPGYERVYLKFSNLGFDDYHAGQQIQKMVKKSDVIVGTSLGAKAVLWANSNYGHGQDIHNKEILIDPCTHRKVLKGNFSEKIIFAIPFMVLLRFVLGWLAFIPVVPSKTSRGKYSLSLFFDQLIALVFGKPSAMVAKNINIILSDKNEFIDKQAVYQLFGSGRITEVDSTHAHLGTSKSAVVYQEAIEDILFSPL